MSRITRYLSPYMWLSGIRSLILTRKVNKALSLFSVRINNHFQPVTITKAPGSELTLNGILYFSSIQGCKDPITISLGRDSRLAIDGDLVIGNGTSIILMDGAHLYIGGRHKESEAGITERSRIMVRKHVHIGCDCIIAWNVFITDCDWHAIAGKPLQEDVFIGDHVWIALNSTILKGSRIGNGCIIGAHSLVPGITLPDKCLAAGNPIRILEENVSWQRDIT